MTLQKNLEQYWPFLALVLWFGYKWWNSRLAEIPKSAPVVLCSASGTRSGMAKMVLKKNGYQQVYNVGTWGKLLG